MGAECIFCGETQSVSSIGSNNKGICEYCETDLKEVLNIKEGE